ncbi:MAG: Hsp20/alpha crystallin family protein [Polyangiaceae bacterium]|nr:Hsp20/alpha crystallin family protein [Polyangiaceae bacterium]
MSIVKYNPPSDILTQFRRDMDQWLGSWFGSDVLSLPAFARTDRVLTPVDLSESDQEFIVRMDVPGAREDDIKVSCQGDRLTIQGERKQERTEEKGNVHYAERQYGAFMRTLTVPGAIKAGDVRARYIDGVLEVHLPKAEKTQTRTIKVERGK